MSELKRRLVLEPLINEYNEKKENASAELEKYEKSRNDFLFAATLQGTYGGDVIRQEIIPSLDHFLKCLRISAWRHVFSFIDSSGVIPASSRGKFEIELQDPPEFTMENIRATFGEYISNPRGSILRGLAEAFCLLDDAYKSHSKVKFGVNGLPKRAIFTNVFYEYGWLRHGYSSDRVIDTLNALRTVQGRSKVHWGTLKDTIDKGIDLDGITFKKFKNGNLHIIFDHQSLLDINMALAEFYGDVLPDVSDDGDEKSKPSSTSVSKNLQYYPTPEKVAENVVHHAYIMDGHMVLEPSCGDGRLIDAVYRLNKAVNIIGYEVDHGRANEAASKGYNVICRNFLEVPPTDCFDVVVMNPPFYGTHYAKHIQHAIKFLKTGGRLVSVLPATAWYDHGKLPNGGTWFDLPVGSFSEVGTNVPTGIFVFRKGENK